ncbi:MAG: hypothetical protein IJY35_02700 [Clostridia bacterium]|nr:hypothetical protein [Clostridia bacterium]
MKKNKHPKPPTGLPEFLAALGIVLVIVLLIPLIRGCSEAEVPDEPIDAAEPIQPEPVSAAFIETPLAFDGATLPAEIDDGVFLTSLTSADGKFVEDGSDEAVTGVLCAVFSNTTDKTIEYMTAVVTVDGEEYRFAVTTLPAGSTVHTLESSRKPAPETVRNLTAEKEYLIWFTREISRHEDDLAYTITDGTIAITNVSGEDIASDIVVYYKNTYENTYMGGITYRVRVTGGLQAGESFNGYAPHATENDTRIMFTEWE